MSEILTHEQHVALVEDLVCCAEQDIRDDMDDSSIATQTRKALVLAQFAALRSALAAAEREAEEHSRTAEAAVKCLGRIGEATWDAGLPGGDREQTLRNVTALVSERDEARDGEAKWRRELDAAIELSERSREIVKAALNQAPEYFYDRHDNGEWSAEHIAHAIRCLFAERDSLRSRLAEMDHLGTGAARSAG